MRVCPRSLEAQKRFERHREQGRVDEQEERQHRVEDVAVSTRKVEKIVVVQ